MVLLFFLSVFGQTSAPYNPTLLSLTWRLQYGLGLLPIAYMLYHRIFKLQESAMWKAWAFPRDLHTMLLLFALLNLAHPKNRKAAQCEHAVLHHNKTSNAALSNKKPCAFLQNICSKHS